MNFVDHFDGCSFLFEDDRTTVTFEYVMEPQQRARSMPFRGHDAQATHPDDNIRAWLDGIVTDEEHKPLVTDVLHALGDMQHPAENSRRTGAESSRRTGAESSRRTGAESSRRTGAESSRRTGTLAKDKKQQAQTKVTVRTMGPGFTGRAPPFASTEFFANMVVVAILLLFAPGFTLLAAGVFFTSRVAERWGGRD